MSFIALVITLVILAAIRSYESVKDGMIRSRRKRYNDVRTRITYRSDCDAIRYFHEDRWNAVCCVSSELRYIFGENWREVLRSEDPCFDWAYKSNSVDGFSSLWNIAFEVWYSRKGYIPSGRYKYNLICFPEIESGKVYGFSDDKEYLNMRACEMIESNIQASHPDLSISLRRGILPSDRKYLVWSYWYELCGIGVGFCGYRKSSSR